MGRRLRRKSTCLVIMRVWVQSPEPTGYGGMWCNPSIEEVETGRTWGLIGQSTISAQWSPCQGRILPHKTRHKQTKNSGVDNVWAMVHKAIVWPPHMWTQTWVDWTHSLPNVLWRHSFTKLVTCQGYSSKQDKQRCLPSWSLSFEWWSTIVETDVTAISVRPAL